MKKVKAKKHLGQHFLKDEVIAEKIAHTLTHEKNYQNILEIGPGMGVVTKYLLSSFSSHCIKAIELDAESVEYLNQEHPDLQVYNKDFLKLNLSEIFNSPFALIGNYPYNISSQIVFKTIEFRDIIPEMTGMFQKEVAERICAKPGNKIYGIISVLTQAFYKAEYLFTVSERVFDPPPKVKSGVLRLTRLETDPNCDTSLLFRVVKQSFNQRRKTLRNSLRNLFEKETLQDELFNERPERLSVSDFVHLTNLAAKQKLN